MRLSTEEALRSLKYWRRSTTSVRSSNIALLFGNHPSYSIGKGNFCLFPFRRLLGLFRRIKVASVENILYNAVLRGITIHSGAAIFGWDDPFRKIETVLNESKLEAGI